MTIKIILTTLLEATNPFSSNQFLWISLWQDFLSEKPALVTAHFSFTAGWLAYELHTSLYSRAFDDCKPNTKQNVASGARESYLQSATDEPNITVIEMKVPLCVCEARVRISARRRAFWLRIFVIFLSPSWKIMERNLKLGHDRFLPYTLKFVISWSFHQSTL